MSCSAWASTLNEYRKYIEKDGALERRFQTVIVDPPTIDETVEILKGLRKYEDHHKVTIPDSTLLIAAKQSERYITDRFLPDKAIDVIDEAGRTRGSPRRRRRRSRRAQGGAGEGDGDKEAAVRDQNFEKAAPRSATRSARSRATSARSRRSGSSGASRPPGPRRGGDRVHRQPLDGNPRDAPAGGGDDAPAADGGRAAPERDRAGRGHQGDQPVDPAQPRGPQGSEPSDRLVHLQRSDGCREDGARPLAREVPVRGRVAHPRRHERVHGEVLRVAAHRRASGLRRLRGFGDADEGDSPEAVLGDPARRDREGAPRTCSTSCSRCSTRDT